MSNEPTLDDFLNVINEPPNAHYHDINYLTNQLFCADDPPRKVPGVGITDYGPQFVGKDKVGEFFTQLFKSFPDLEMKEVRGAPRLFSEDDNTIGIQTTLSGMHMAEWFPRGNDYYSPPLSGIHPDKHHVMRVPACAVFTFDNKKICRLAIYTDRYRMMRQLTPAS
jgi:hypothetical protein